MQRAADISEVKKIARGRALVLAKIEKPQAISRLDEIIEMADALMVARGDLGVEMPLEKVPGIQKRMTRMSRVMGKPVVVATQMLESMISSPVPTRAEVSDVATAVYEGADAVMLSAESAAGQFPVEAVETMNRIAEEVETDGYYRSDHQRPARRCADADRRGRHRGRDARCRRDARSQGRLRLDVVRIDRLPDRARAALAADPGADAEAATPRGGCRSCGASMRLSRRTPTTSTTWRGGPTKFANREGFSKQGDRVIIVAGVPFGTPGATNMLRIAFCGSES